MAPRMNNLENPNYINNYYEPNIENIDDENYNIYDADEPSSTKYNIVLCELYNNTHGTPNTNSQHLYYNYLTIYRFKTLNINEINEIVFVYNDCYEFIENRNRLSPIRNFENISTRDNYVKPEIAQCIVLESGHNVSILKTFWLRLVQRRWKNIFRNRKNILRLRCQPAALKFRETHSCWPANCAILPSIRGMLFNV